MPNIPILSAIKRYSARARHRFHMPGHKGTLPFLGEAASLDVTELEGLDNLHAPSGCIMEAQRLCAEAFGSKRAFFLVNGSSAGIHAFLLALGEGKRVVLERGAHRSFVNGAALSGHTVSLLPQRQRDGVTLPADPLDVAEALKVPAAAVCVTYPNYYGLCPDLAAIKRECERAGALLFADAAHGAHFEAGSPYPKSACAYADALVLGAHKTLCALTQGAYLHSNHEALGERLGGMLSVVQTSSPSYLIMASLDCARAAFDRDAWKEHASLCERLRERLNALGGIYCPEFAPYSSDPARVVIDVSGRMDGYEAKGELLARGIAVEMADSRRLVLITTPSDGDTWPQELAHTLGTLPFRQMPAPASEAPDLAPLTLYNLRAALLGDSEDVPLSEAIGRTAASAVGLYPPGAPLIWPGEQIGENVIQYIRAMSRIGSEPFGTDGERVRVTRK